ncbi:hypothetical protein QBC42DRAFT_272792 [Cladorrhinum samala]|uniref:Pentatricopeptide repeat-containing protein n=1 Tax=Cladorrhinum samala TaxID=585594 RepID=A0AAV9HHV4_9PEZI|nr:hypothetical protein QBC42DRAFT_272792 [Cladorrhinum samala]
MQAMLGSEDRTTIEAYDFFAETILPKIQKLGVDVSKHVSEKIGTILLSKLAREKAEDFDAGTLPSVTRLTDIMIELNVLTPSTWGKLMLQLLQHIIRINVSFNRYTSIQSYEMAMAHREDLLRDLLGAWRSWVAHKPPAGGESPADVAAEGGDEPAVPLQRIDGLHKIFASTFTQYTSGTLPRPTWAAYATFRMLQDPINSNKSLEEAARPFMKLMEYMISRCRPPRPYHYEQELSLYPDILEYLYRRSGLIPDEARKASATSSNNKNNIAPASNMGTEERNDMDITKVANDARQPGPLPNIPLSTSKNIANGPPKMDPTNKYRRIALSALRDQDRRDRLHRQLTQAIKSAHPAAARKVWQEFWGTEPVPSPARKKELEKHRNMFDYFILAYMTMRRPNLAIEVWDKMESIGIKPAIETWDSMMQGCAKTKNPDGIRAVWEKLLKSGVKLDTHIWTSRISGLFNSGDPEGGIRALNEMAVVWNQRSKPEFANIAVQPSIEPVNAALAGLFRCERDGDAGRVLSWAASYNIKPDIFTFNTLLRPLLRRGDQKGVEGVLNTMRGAGIEADVATFTIMLEGTLSHIGTRDPAEQIAIVTRVLDEMNAAGIEANMQTYGKIMYILLYESESSERAVQAVLAHIWGSGLELSSQIYTMLANYYFTRDPPESAAVTSLIERRGLKSNRDIDRIFWERVIKGYCAAGETERALDIFENVIVSSGITKIASGTLYDLLSSLQEVGAWDAANRLVEYAISIPEDQLLPDSEWTGPGRGGGGGGGGELFREAGLRGYRHRFWHLAYQLGLLKGEMVERFANASNPTGRY